MKNEIKEKFSSIPIFSLVKLKGYWEDNTNSMNNNVHVLNNGNN